MNRRTKEAIHKAADEFSDLHGDREANSYEDFTTGAKFGFHLSQRWNTWPKEIPEKDGKYLTIVQDRKFRYKLQVRTFNKGDWIFTVKTEICYWLPIPELPAAVINSI